RDGQRLRRGRPTLLSRRTGAGVPVVGRLPAADIREATPGPCRRTSGVRMADPTIPRRASSLAAREKDIESPNLKEELCPSFDRAYVGSVRLHLAQQGVDVRPE